MRSVLILLTYLAVGCATDASSPPKSLYERLGGDAGITAVVDDFIPRITNDPDVNFARKGVPTTQEWQTTPRNVQHVKAELIAFIGSATGGPQKYTGRDMKAMHVDMQITSAEFDACADDLRRSMEKLKVPKQEQDELLAIVETTRSQIVTKK